MFFLLIEEISSNTCSLLNCKDYWELPSNEVSKEDILITVVWIYINMQTCEILEAIIVVMKQTQKNSGGHIGWGEVCRLRYVTVEWQKHSGQMSAHARRLYG